MHAFDITLKHAGGMPDLHARVEIDAHEQRVTLELDCIDSLLVCNLVTHVLPRDHGVVAFRDARQGWSPQRPPYSLRILFDTRYYWAEVAFVGPTEEASLFIDSGAAARTRQARASAAAALAELHRSGVEALVTGVLAQGTDLPRDGQVDILVLGETLGQQPGRITGLERLVREVMTSPFRMMFEELLGPEETQRLLGDAVLRWDPARRRLTTVRPNPEPSSGATTSGPATSDPTSSGSGPVGPV